MVLQRGAEVASPKKAGRKLFYGWWVVVASFAVMMWGAGAFYYGFSAFFNPIRQDFEWGATITSVAFAIRGAETGVADFFVGFLVDRFGPRKVTLASVVLLGAGFVALGFVNSLWSFYGAVVVIAAGFSGCAGPAQMTAVANWFARKRGTALGIMMAGGGAGGLLVPLIAWSIGANGWRPTAVALGLLTWALGIPITMLVRHKPEQYGYLPDGDSPGAAVAERLRLRAQGTGREYRASDALRTPAFWFIALGFAIALFGLNGIVPHLIPFLTSQDVGLSVERAALIVTLMTVSSNAGRLGFGWLGDHIQKRYVVMTTFAIQAVAIFMLAFTGPQLWQVVLFAISYGVGYGGSLPLRAAIQGDYFGRRAFGTLLGIIMGVSTLVGMASPVFAGAVFDATGSYHMAFLGMGVVVACSVPLVFLARRPAVSRVKV